MDVKLKGKTALVTGSSTGIGKAIAKALAREGVYVLIHGRNEHELQQTLEEIAQEGGKASSIKGDLSNDEEARNVSQKGLEVSGGVDILINNAGSFLMTNWDEISTSEWLQMYNSNVVSMVRMIQWLMPPMKKKKWGRIIQISSTFGIHPPKGMADYSATKAAIHTITESLSKELAGSGITVNTISPGAVLTERIVAQLQTLGKEKGWDWNQVEEFAAKEIVPTPMGRWAKPHEIADFVTFLTSPLADFITGANLSIDGGYIG